MNKKNIKKGMQSVFISVLFLGGVGFVFASDGTFINPTCAAPNCNTATPLNVSSLKQIKAGPLYLNQATSNPWAIGLVVAGGSVFNQLDTTPGILVNNVSGQSPTSSSFLKWHSDYAGIDGWIKGMDKSTPGTTYPWETQLHTDQNFGISVGSNVTSDILLVSQNNVGINNPTPQNALDVTGKIHATGDICTDLNGGVCLGNVKGGGTGGNTTSTTTTYNITTNNPPGVTQITQGNGIIINPPSGVGNVTVSTAPAWTTVDPNDKSTFYTDCQYRMHITNGNNPYYNAAGDNGTGPNTGSTEIVYYASIVGSDMIKFVSYTPDYPTTSTKVVSQRVSTGAFSYAGPNIIIISSTDKGHLSDSQNQYSASFPVTKLEKNCGGSGSSLIEKTNIIFAQPLSTLQAAQNKNWTIYYKYHGASPCDPNPDPSGAYKGYGNLRAGDDSAKCPYATTASTILAGNSGASFGTVPYGGIDLRADAATLHQFCSVLFSSPTSGGAVAAAPFGLSAPGSQIGHDSSDFSFLDPTNPFLYGGNSHSAINNYVYWDPNVGQWFLVQMGPNDGTALMQANGWTCTSSTASGLSHVTTVTAPHN